MNDTIRLLQSHRSERSYKSAEVPEEFLEAVIEAAHRAPTSINTQQVSVIVVRDPERRRRISEIAGGQPWIAQAPVFLLFVVDLYKTGLGVSKAGAAQQAQRSVESLLSAATDVGIALEAAMVAARSLGLGIVPIGGIRRDPQAMIELLGLPEQTFPLAGICMGWVEHPATQKPRLPIASFRHDEQYHPEALAPAIDAYDELLPEYWKKIGRADGLSWSANTAGAYRSVYFPQVKPAVLAQGFSCEE